MTGPAILLHTRDLQTGYRSKGKATAVVAGPLELSIQEGQLICLLGPNGSGKSTLLKTLSGLLPALDGTVEITGIPSGKLSPGQLAKKISLVLTDRVRTHQLTAYALVALGRYPHSGWLGILDDKDKAIIDRAIEATGIEALLDRKMSTLSDGESQKVMLARALAQDTPILMLDEPTAHLDLPSRIQLMRLLHRVVRETHKGILVSTHELDLALQVAGEVWLLQAGGQFHRGAPEDLVLNGVFEAAFAREGISFNKGTGSFTVHEGNTVPITMTGGDAVTCFWTGRALQRQGFSVDTSDGTDTPVVRILEQTGGRTRWRLENTRQPEEFDTLANLLQALTKITYICVDRG